MASALDMRQNGETNKIVCIKLLLIENIRTLPKIHVEREKVILASIVLLQNLTLDLFNVSLDPVLLKRGLPPLTFFL